MARIWTLAACLASLHAAHAAPLEVGDPAPPVEIDHWLTPLDGAPATPTPMDRPGIIYVVDFWATWFGPCLAGFGELTELARRWSEHGVEVVAVSDESTEVVAAFMRRRSAGTGRAWGERMGFRVACDPDQSTHQSLLLTQGPYSLPMTFVVRDGVVEFIGHPQHDDLAGAVASLVEGSWDRAAFRARREARLADERRWAELVESPDVDAAEAAAADRPDRLAQLAWTLAHAPDAPDLDRAERLARRSVALSEGRYAMGLHVLAYVRFARGDARDAARIQRLAIEHDDGTGAEHFRQALDAYERAAAGG